MERFRVQGVRLSPGRKDFSLEYYDDSTKHWKTQSVLPDDLYYNGVYVNPEECIQKIYSQLDNSSDNSYYEVLYANVYPRVDRYGSTTKVEFEVVRVNK